jgi:1,4-alpha-glucan branching enzyme
MKKIFYYVLCVSFLFTACKKNSKPPVFPDAPNLGAKPTDLPPGAKNGVVFINNGTSAIVTLYAPYKKSVSVIGDFNNWLGANAVMKKANDGNTWWIQIDNLNPNTEYAYQFLIDGSLKVADPYCEKVLDEPHDKFISNATYPNLKPYPTGKTTGVVSIMHANKEVYKWKNTNFKRPDKNNLVIYELLIRDFTEEHNYASTLAKLDYLIDLGINAIGLMPVNEFEGNISWGYNPSYYFAPDKYYGTKVALQNFIDECHGKGIAVIYDMVLNHSFGQSPMVQMYFNNNKPTADNPWFNTDAKHPYNVGFDFNHESIATKNFSKDVIKFWMQEYKIDGFRFDLSKGFTQNFSNTDGSFSAYDASRVAIWRDYNNFMKSIDNNNFYVILEHFADVNEQKVLADEGMMFWNNINHSLNEATIGWLPQSDFSWGFFSRQNLAKTEHLVTYMESHDEERINYKNLTFGNNLGAYAIRRNLPVSLKRIEMASAFLFSIPGPKLMWQFGEVGYDFNIDFNGRTGPKPIRWDYFADPNRKSLYDAFAKFIKLKKNNSIFNSVNTTFNLTGAIKHIKLVEGNNTVFVVGNFDVQNQNANIDFGASGSWFDAVGTPINLSTNTYTATFAPGEFHIFSKIALK